MTSPAETKPYMELLAPAGSFAAFEAAVEAGADAVYIGAPGFNARALTRDFTYPEIAAMADYAHSHGVKLFVAMNSLVKEGELPEAARGLAYLAAIRPDALILQDLGLLGLAREYFPELPLHASTLLSAHNAMAVEQLVKLGCQRIVLPRELTIDEIGSIFRATGADLEVFVHGAMCFSYSGLCLFSSMHGGKSSMRGQCVQPCRRRYGWVKKNVGRKGGVPEKGGGYLFSMNDLSGIDFLPRLKAAGVACLKIEGRMKSVEYVRNTVRAYRLLLDAYARDTKPGKKLLQEAQKLLDAAMGRKRASGFFPGKKPEDAVTPHLTGNIGTMVGRVKRLDEVGSQLFLTVQLREDISLGDRLRLHDDVTGERSSFSLRSMKLGNRYVKRARAGQNVAIILEKARSKSRAGGGRGSLFRVDIGSGGRMELESKKHLLAGDGTGINPDRRLEHILSALAGKANSVKAKPAGRPQWWVQINSWQDMRLRLPVQPSSWILRLSQENIGFLRQGRIPAGVRAEGVIWSLPPVILPEALPWYTENVTLLRDKGFTAFQVGHYSQVGLFEEKGSVPAEVRLYGGYTLNILNSQAVRLLTDQGFAGLQLSIEADRDNLFQILEKLRRKGIEDAGSSGAVPLGLCVFGRPPLFSSRLDDTRYRYNKRFVSPKGEIFELQREKELTFARSILPFSLLRFRRELEKGGLAFLVVDLSSGNIRKNIAEFQACFYPRGRDTAVLEGNYEGSLV